MEQEIATIIRSANAAAGRQALGDDRRGNYHRLANAGLSAWGGRLDPDLRLYPEAVVSNYMRSCLKNSSVTQAYCACTLDKLSNTVSTADFARIGLSGGHIPARVRRLIQRAAHACVNKL